MGAFLGPMGMKYNAAVRGKKGERALKIRSLIGLGLAILLAVGIAGCAWLNPTTAVLRVSDRSGVVPFRVTYDASASDARGGVDSVHWSFGDGGESVSSAGAYTYHHAGSYEIALTVRGVDGSIDRVVEIVEVAPAFWTADENLGVIYKLSPDGQLLHTIASPAPQPRGLALSKRGEVWSLHVVCMGGGFQRLFELDPETGEVLAERSAPAQSPGGLALAPQLPSVLWHVDRMSRKIYELDAGSGGVLNSYGASYFQAAPHHLDAVFLYAPTGMAWAEGPAESGSIWVLEETSMILYQLTIVPSVGLFSGTQLEIQAESISISEDLRPVSGLEWYDGFFWVVERHRHRITQVNPETGQRTGVFVPGGPGAALSGLAIQR